MPSQQLLSRDQLESIAHDHLATDLLTEASPELVAKLASATLEEATAFFESGGTTLPPSTAKPPSEKKRLLCLHSSSGSGVILRTQLAPLGLDASFDLDFLDGLIEVDPGSDADAAMLRRFFPTAPNRDYVVKVEHDISSGAERPSLGNATDAALLAEMGINAPKPRDPADEMGKEWRMEYRGVDAALTLLSARIAGEAHAGRRYDGGVLAFSQGANLLVLLLGVLEAAEHAASAEEATAAALPIGPEKATAKKAAKAAMEAAQARSRLVRPPAALLFCPSDFGWMAPFADAALVGRCIRAVDDGIRQAVDDGIRQAVGIHQSVSIAEASTLDVSDAARPIEAPPDGALPDASAVATPSSVPMFTESTPALAKTKTLIVLGSADPLNPNGKRVARRFATGCMTLLEHSGGHKPPPRSDPSIIQRVVNFATRGMADEIISGCSAFYRHRTLGWIAVKVTKVDYQGECDGGATYCVTAPQLDGEVETVRTRLALSKPDEVPTAPA